MYMSVSVIHHRLVDRISYDNGLRAGMVSLCFIHETACLPRAEETETFIIIVYEHIYIYDTRYV